MTQIFAPGPIAITTITGAHQVVPLAAMSTDPAGKVQIVGWPVTPPAVVTQATDWANYLLSQGMLSADPSLSPPPAGPPFFVKAVNPGLLGDQTVIKITNVNTAVIPATMDMEVTVTNSYTGLTPDGIDEIIGTVAHGGTQPGMVYLSPTSPAEPRDMPGNTPAPVPFAAGNPLTADIIEPSPPGTNVVFTLAAPADGGAGTFTAAISNAAGTTFDLTISWHKKLLGKNLSDLANEFSYVIVISPPPSANYGVPKNNSTITLDHGTDPQSVTEPATSATGAAEAAP